MVSWAGDGLLVGYDPLTMKLKAGLYHFASSGSVDVGAITRINYPMGAGLSAVKYSNALSATAPFTFTAGDLSANFGKKFIAAMYLCDASSFPAGHVPKPSEILALGDAKVSVFRSTSWVNAAMTFTYTIPGWSGGLLGGAKYWVLILPAALTDADLSASPTLATTRPMAGINVDTFGRALSVLANQTPTAPTIVSPVSGTVVNPGAVFNLTINPNDPDEGAPEDGHRLNDDVAGVQFQYAPWPTTDNPNPTWTDLPLDVGFSNITARFSAWYIRGSHYWDFNGAPLPEMVALVDNLGLPVVAANLDTMSTRQPGKGALPTGNWQIRARTFDFGHPYPNIGTDLTQPGPLGLNLATTFFREPVKDYYPAANTSPWSTPVRITIPAQVPPPIPLSPKDRLAVGEGPPVRLSWQFRNTHQPPRDQYRRAVQIRKVGDINWSTIYDGFTSQQYVDLANSLVQIPVLPATTGDNLESGSLTGWAALNPTFPSALANVSSAPNAHSGSRYLQVTSPTGIAQAQFNKMFTSPGPDYENATVGFWVWSAGGAPVSSSSVFVLWQDAGGAAVIPPGVDILNTPFIVIATIGPLSAGWNHVTLPACHRPPGGVNIEVDFYPDGPVAGVQNVYRFDDLTVDWAGVGVDNFTMSATNEYEWRVKATDTDGIISNYSESARFWMVPAAGSGALRPVPTETTEGATLGCGTHRVEVYRRGGTHRVGEITNLSRVDWGRVRDDISSAKVIVSGWDIDCGNLLSQLQTWAYELVIWRDNGYSVDRVWEGPITGLTYETDKVTIDAGDMMRYAYRRIIKQAMNDSGTGKGTTVVDRARRVLQNVFAPDDPNILAYLQVLSREDDATQHRSVPAYSRTAFEEVDDMAANAGLDYTVVGRSIMLWGTKHRIGTLPEFSDNDLGSPPIVSEYGMSFANRYVVADGNGLWGEATRLDVSGNDETYGLVEMLSSTWASDSPSDTGTYTQEGLQTLIHSFEHFAERAIADRNPPPVVVRVPDNTTLNPGTVISIQNLVPGVVVPLRSMGTLRQIVASQKLDSVKVVEEGGTETVSITLSPFNRDDTISAEGG